MPGTVLVSAGPSGVGPPAALVGVVAPVGSVAPVGAVAPVRGVGAVPPPVAPLPDTPAPPAVLDVPVAAVTYIAPPSSSTGVADDEVDAAPEVEVDVAPEADTAPPSSSVG